MSLLFTKRLSSWEGHLKRMFVALVLFACLRNAISKSSSSSMFFIFPIWHSWWIVKNSDPIAFLNFQTIRFFSIPFSTSHRSLSVSLYDKSGFSTLVEQNFYPSSAIGFLYRYLSSEPQLKVHKIPPKCIFHSSMKLLMFWYSLWHSSDLMHLHCSFDSNQRFIQFV